MSAPLEMVFTFLACADLKRIWEAIAMPADIYGATVSENLAAAEEFASRFSRHCAIILENPEMGLERDDLLDGMRCSPFQRYEIFYRLRGERMEVLRVLRASADPGVAA
jgi:plasmid stabilization system protein ParE